MSKFRTLALVGAMLFPASLLLASAAVRAEDKITIGVSLPQDDNPFYIGMLKGIRARATELGWDVATVSSNEDKLKQINGVQDLVAKGVRGILISPIDAPDLSSARVTACFSARSSPGAGAIQLADAPPESRTRTRSSAPAASASARVAPVGPVFARS